MTHFWWVITHESYRIWSPLFHDADYFLFSFLSLVKSIHSAFWLVDLISSLAYKQISSTLFQFTCDSFPWVIRMTHWWIIRWLTSITLLSRAEVPLTTFQMWMMLSCALWCYLNEQNCPKKDSFLQDKPCLASKSLNWAGQTSKFSQN